MTTPLSPIGQRVYPKPAQTSNAPVTPAAVEEAIKGAQDLMAIAQHERGSTLTKICVKEEKVVLERTQTITTPDKVIIIDLTVAPPPRAISNYIFFVADPRTGESQKVLELTSDDLDRRNQNDLGLFIYNHMNQKLRAEAARP